MPPVVKVGDKNELVDTSTFSLAKFPFEKFNCFHRNTKFVTSNGVKSFYDFDCGDTVSVLTNNGVFKIAQVKCFGKDRLYKLVIKKAGSKRVKEILTTANHIWFIRSFNKYESKKKIIEKQTNELIIGDKLSQRFRHEARDVKLSSIGIMHGLVFGDGTYSKCFNDCRIHLCADSRQFKKYFFDGHVIEYDKEDQTIIYGLPSDWKQLPRQINEEYLAGFLAGWFAADGKLGGNPVLSCMNKEHLEFVKNYIAPILGLDVSDVFIEFPSEKNGTYKTDNNLYGIRFYQHTFKPYYLLKESHHKKYNKGNYKLYWSVVSIEDCGIEDDVWCVVEPETNTFVLDGGIVTHNCVQSRVLEYYDKDNNILIASSTSSGKTCNAEIVLAHEVRVNKCKGIYLVPYKSIAQEKYDEWQSKEHHFGDLNVSVVTGDYRLTEERKKELDNADLIIMSYEMFSSRTRNASSERSEFLNKTGVLVVDEGHSISSPNRGHHLECALMKFTEINNKCRLIILSATMPNVDEVANWISFILNNKSTILVSSKFRPCPLFMHYEKYDDSERNYYDNESQKVNSALDIVECYPNDKFLVFVHTKGTGKLMLEALRGAGIKAEFHNGDLDKAKRTKIENEFKDDGKDLRVIVATSTLAAGVNMPARRVIVCGVHRGLEEVETNDIIQECGRSGRPQFDPAGDAYVLLPERTYDMHKARLKTPQIIQSQMLAVAGEHHKVLAFHLVSEIHQETIKNREDVHHWYKRSLACFQANELDESIVDHTMDLLKKCGAVWEEEGQYTITSIGKIASLFYFSPFDVSDLKKNFTGLFDNNKQDDDLSVAVALANIDTHRFGIVSKAEREEMSLFANKVGKGTVMEPAIKVAYAYHQMMNGIMNPIFVSLTRGLHFDFPRLNQILQAIDGFTGKWQKTSWFRQLQLRVTYGVKGPMVELCQLPHIGKVRANKLWKEGLRDFLAIINSPDRVRKATGLKTAEVDEILAEAKRLFAFSS